MKSSANKMFITSGSGERSVPIRQIVRGYSPLFFTGQHNN
jgi:hypothetical protein